jgi:hypothetical protein
MAAPKCRDNQIMAAVAETVTAPQRRRAPSIPRELQNEIAAHAKVIGKKYRKLFNADGKLKQRIARLTAVLLPPRARRGRPRDPTITRALALYHKRRRQYSDERPRESWYFVAGKLIQNFDSYNQLERRALVDDLRTRAKSRRRKSRPRKSR